MTSARGDYRPSGYPVAGMEAHELQAEYARLHMAVLDAHRRPGADERAIAALYQPRENALVAELRRRGVPISATLDRVGAAR